jgi:hypothetical protein
MSKIERPGVDQRWMKSWKADRRNGIEWRDTNDSSTATELQYFAQHGETLELIESRRGSDPAPMVIPPRAGWESIYVTSHMSMYGVMRQFETEMRGMAGEPFDSALAVRAFAAIQTHEMIELYSFHFGLIRFGEGRGAGVGMMMSFLPFTALGVIIGCREEAFQLASLQVSGYRKGRYNRDRMGYPIFHFILRVLADYLGKPPIELLGVSLKEPIFNALFDTWRTPDAAALVDICLAACDEHTRRCKPGKDVRHEFDNGEWTRTPI